MTVRNMELVLDVMLQIDFKKIHDVMEFLNWTWYIQEDKGEKVPEIYQLQESCKKRLFELIEKAESGNHDYYNMGSGGFEFIYDKRYGEVDLTVRFVLEEGIAREH